MTRTDPYGAPQEPPSNPYGPVPGPGPGAGSDSALPGYDDDAWTAPPAAGAQGAGLADPAPRRGVSRGAWIALAASIVVTLLLVLCLVAGFVLTVRSAASSDDWSSSSSDPGMTTEDGTVLDANGSPVLGVGTIDAPATAGEHSLRWPSDDGGTITVHVTAIDWDADTEVEAADPLNDPPPDGYLYALVSLDVTYAGTGWINAYDSLSVYAESPSSTMGQWDTTARPAQPLWRAGGITDGETASGQIVLPVLRDEAASSAISIATWNGTPLYVR